MRKIFLITLFLSIQFVFSQKNYTFNLVSVYEEKPSTGNHFTRIVFNDTISNDYFFSVISKNNTISSNLIDFKRREIYTYDTFSKRMEEIDFSKDFKSYYTSQMHGTPEKTKEEMSNRYKYYKRSTEKLNDSTEIETFNFYKDRKNKHLMYTVKIESLTTKFIKNTVPSDFIFIIKNCIDENYGNKIVKSIHEKHLKNDVLNFEEYTKLLSINPTNFSINIQQ